MGNLVRDPELTFTKKGTPVARFTIAASNEFVDKSTGEVKEQTAYVNCVAWNKLGEHAGKLIKGNRCIVNGRLQTRSYETKADEAQLQEQKRIEEQKAAEKKAKHERNRDILRGILGYKRF